MKEIRKGRFLRRPNRFVIEMELDGETVRAHMPNPGRMRELLFRGRRSSRSVMKRKGTARRGASSARSGTA